MRSWWILKGGEQGVCRNNGWALTLRTLLQERPGLISANEGEARPAIPKSLPTAKQDLFSSTPTPGGRYLTG